MLKNVKIIYYFWHTKCLFFNVVFINLLLEETHLHIDFNPLFGVFIFV
jgi:hypothetical protein